MEINIFFSRPFQEPGRHSLRAEGSSEGAAQSSVFPDEGGRAIEVEAILNGGPAVSARGMTITQQIDLKPY